MLRFRIRELLSTPKYGVFLRRQFLTTTFGTFFSTSRPLILWASWKLLSVHHMYANTCSRVFVTLISNKICMQYVISMCCFFLPIINMTQSTMHETGSIVFVKYIVILMAGSMVVMMAMVHFFATRCNSNSSELRDKVECISRLGNETSTINCGDIINEK